MIAMIVLKIILGLFAAMFIGTVAVILFYELFSPTR